MEDLGHDNMKNLSEMGPGRGRGGRRPLGKLADFKRGGHGRIRGPIERREGTPQTQDADESSGRLDSTLPSVAPTEQNILVDEKKVKPGIIKKNDHGINTEAVKKENELKKKFVKQYGIFELVKKSLKFSLQNWKLQCYNQVNTFLSQIFMIFIPMSNAKVITAITKGLGNEELYTAVRNYALLLTVKLVVSELMQFIAYYFIKVEATNYRNIVMENISKKDIEFFDLFKSGELKERISQSEQCLDNNFLFKTISLVQHLIKFIVIAYSLFKMSKVLTLTYIVVFTIRFGWEQFLNYKFEFRNFKKRRANMDLYSNALQEFLGNIKLIKAFATEALELKKLQELKSKLNRPIFDVQGFCFKISEFINQITDLLMLYTAGKKVFSGELSYGDYILFQSYSAQLRGTFTMIKNSYEDYRKMFEGWAAFFEIYDFVPKITSLKSLKPSYVQGEIKFDDVVFGYPLKPDVKVLNNLNMTIEPGKTVAIVGHSGSGKTTIANMILRFYDPNEGTITLDGTNLKDFDVEFLRKQIGFVSQEPSLYSTTIEDNVTYGVTEYTQEKFDYVCKLSNIDTFVNNNELFPQGYKTLVGEKGAQVSGGQKQRIAIARALMKDVKILIFDEATSALDAESEGDVQRAINNIIKEKKITTIIIAHRLSTIKNSDYILFMDKGKIIEQGTHSELLAMNGEYKKLIQKQLESLE